MVASSAESRVRVAPREERLLEVCGLSVWHGGAPLVDDVGFGLGRGETIGIVGESGSGKSLLARAIAALLPHGVTATGSIAFAGSELIGLRERRLRQLRGSRISLLLQDPFTMLNPLRTVEAHIVESLAPGASRGSRARRRADVVARLAEVGIDDGAAVARRYPFELSGGMRQRVALAAALAKDPELLIADEPTTALDVTTQREVLALLRRVQEARGMSLVLITHDLRVAFDVCHRIVVMYAGAMLEDLPARLVQDEPRHPYTLGLLRAIPSAHAYQGELHGIPGAVPRAADVTDRCAFADRCQWAQAACRARRPTLAPTGAQRRSACLRHREIAGELEHEVRTARATESAREPDRARAALLRVTDLHKRYPARGLARGAGSEALKGVSFELGAGESVGIVGESGSGKTTIARCLLGLTSPTSGAISLDGADLSHYGKLSRAAEQAIRRRVQCVFQDPYASLNPAHSVGFALAEAIAARAGASGGRRTVGELLELVGLPAAYATRRPAALSGGERQRVAIARALAVEPQVLICDEPVAALDVSVQAQVLSLLRQVHRDTGTSLLFITHDLAVVRQVTDRLLVLYRGELVEHGATEQVLDAPQHPYTRQLRSAMPGAGDAAIRSTT